MWQASTLKRIREATVYEQFLAAMVASGIAFVIVSLLTAAPHGSAGVAAKLGETLTVPQGQQPDLRSRRDSGNAPGATAHGGEALGGATTASSAASASSDAVPGSVVDQHSVGVVTQQLETTVASVKRRIGFAATPAFVTETIAPPPSRGGPTFNASPGPDAPRKSTVSPSKGARPTSTTSTSTTTMEGPCILQIRLCIAPFSR